MKNFKVGDLVAVYGHVRPDSYYLRGEEAEITSISNVEDEIEVYLPRLLLATEVHPKQCRMLKRRKPCKACGK